MSIVYDPTLVMLSIFVAIIGALTGVAVTFGYDGSTVQLSPKSLVRGAAIIGGSIWSMHFIAMLAVKFPVPIDYSSTETLLSLCVAIFFTGAGLTLGSLKGLGPLKIPVAAAIMGSGIGSMHYLGMSAIRGCGISYDFNWWRHPWGLRSFASPLRFGLHSASAEQSRRLLVAWFSASQSRGCTIQQCMQRAFIRSSLRSISGLRCFRKQILALSVAAATLIICGYYLFLFSSMLTTRKRELW